MLHNAIMYISGMKSVYCSCIVELYAWHQDISFECTQISEIMSHSMIFCSIISCILQ